MHDFTRRNLMIAGVATPFVLPLSAGAAAASVAHPALHADLDFLKRFIGRWRGKGEGQPGVSAVERTYEPTLGGRFILVNNTSTYKPQTKNPKGEVHNDVGFFSFDQTRKRAVLRQFNVEGFVNQYLGSTPAFDGDAFVVESEAIENIPAGWRARESYRFSGDHVFEETFELAEPGKAYELYSRNHLNRV